MNKRKIISALMVTAAIFCSVFGSNDAFAGGWEGIGNYGSGSISDDGGGGGGVTSEGTYWIKYNLDSGFKNNASLASNSVYIAPQYRKFTEVPPSIDAECNKGDSEGVWIFGQTSSGSTKVFGGYFYYLDEYDGFGGKYKGYGFSTWSGFLLKYYKDGSDKIDDTYVDGNGHYSIYRRSEDGLGIYNVVSSAGRTPSWGDTNGDGVTDVTAAVVSIYYSNGGAPTLAYQSSSDSIAANKDTIVSEYKKYMQYTKGADGKPLYTQAEIDSMTYEKMTAAKAGGSLYAFCAYPESTKTEDTQKGKVTISAGGVTATAGFDTTTGTQDLGEVNEPTLEVTTSYDFERNLEEPEMTFKAQFNRAGDASPYDKELTYSSSELTNQEPTTKTVTLTKGDNTICSSTKYPGSIDDESTVTYDNSSPSREACITVKYVPLIANEIDSRTSAVVSEGPKSGVSDPDNGDAGDPGIDANIPYGKDVTVNWKHSLGIKRVEKDDGKHVALNPLMGKFRVKYAKLGESWATSGLSKELSSGTYNSGLDNFNVDNLYETDKVKLLPGDKKELLRGITHPQTVKNDSAATSTGNESSSLKVTLTADTVKCAINGKDIGVNNPDNYAKMSMSISAPYTYKSRTVGDGVDDSGNPYPSSATVWLKSSDKINKISYSVCNGAQIAYDRAWLNSNPSVTDWTSASIGTLDKYSLTMIPYNDTLSRNLYGRNYNGKSPAKSIKIGGIENKNIRADEIGDNQYLQARVDASYQLKNQETVESKAEYQLGESIDHNISFRTSYSDGTIKKYSITTKVPYNYVINPDIDGLSNDALYLGSDVNVSVNFNVRGRVNEKVTSSTEATYSTTTKTTKHYTAIFALDANKTLNDLITSVTTSGATRIKDDSGNDTRDFYIQSDAGFEDILQNQIGGTPIVSTEDASGSIQTKVGEGVAVSVGTKYCAVAAVWPADSHNIMDESGVAKILDSTDQTNALSGDIPGTGAYWRFELSCQTLGKKPTVSVEGYGLISGGSVVTSTTNYDGNIFGSWSEYGLIADNGTSVKFGTGASLAYHGPQYSVNEQAIPPSEAGLNKDAKCIGIETVGNIKCLEQVGLDSSEISQYVSNAYSIKNRIIGKNNVSKHNGTYVIDSDVSKNADGTTPIIYADNIKIRPDVKEINAILIADDNLDTCYLEDKQNETTQGKTEGNWGLKDYCGNQLVVNGAVFANSITLDRTYGGGSYGDNLWAPSLVQRAEVFNFDPSYVSEVYEQSLEEDPITTTYIKELPSRY